MAVYRSILLVIVVASDGLFGMNLKESDSSSQIVDLLSMIKGPLSLNGVRQGEFWPDSSNLPLYYSFFDSSDGSKIRLHRSA
uniref:Uncharacterized protein n=1 Tax=Parascaris univalens TaxID=6257 RepID=A0A915AUE9_PARUN